MDEPLNQDSLVQRIAELESELKALRRKSSALWDPDANPLACLNHAADGICVCHAIDHFPFARFTFWNRRMVDLTGYTIDEINRHGCYQSVCRNPEVQAKAAARMTQLWTGDNLEAEIWEITCADGTRRSLRISTSTLDPGYRSPNVMAVIRDATADKNTGSTPSQVQRAEGTHSDNDTRYRTLFEVAGDAIFIENDSDEIVEINQRACELLGYTREELLSMKVCDIQAPECRGEPGQILNSELATYQGKPFETQDLHKDGTRIPVEVTNTRLKEAGLFLSIVRDIRERKALEQARRETFDIIEKSPVVAFLWRNEADWPVEFVTANVGLVFGYSDHDFLSGHVSYSKVVHPDDLNRVAEEVTAFSQDPNRSKFTHEPYRIVARNGSIRWIADSTFIRRDATGTITHYQGIVTDVTDRIRAEEALRHSEDEKRTILDSLKELVIYTDTRMRIVWANKAACESVGVPVETLIGSPCHSFWGNSLTPCPSCVVVPAMKSGRIHQAEVQTPDGRIWFNRGHPVFNENGVVSGGIETCLEITERKQAEAALSREKERLAVTLRSIGDAVITTDCAGRILLMNPIAERLTGWSEADAYDRLLMDVFRIENEQTGERCENPVDKVLASGQIVGLANHTVLVAKNGQRYTIADSGAPILDFDKKIIGVVLVFRDITAQQRTEAELLKMEKLKSIGVLAGGIAHDFNNFLASIIGNLSLAKLDAQPGSPVSRCLEEMEKAALRAKELPQQLLTFSKGGEPVKRTTGIAELVREAVQFALHGSNVRCKFDIDAELMAADVDEGQITQVIHNLIINADQAMPNGGTVSIRGANVSLTKGNPYAVLPGDYIQVAIQDNGMGIHQDHLKKVFDPYFTTKQKGSGLGLAVAYNIVANHDGQVIVDSKLGEGTTFTILLPATAVDSRGNREKNGTIVTGQGRIMVMDDDNYIRKVASAMLTKLGYEAVVAEDGQTAVELYRKAINEGRPFDAVILDLTVPGGMGGKEAIGYLIEMDKNVRAIVSSGYSNDPVLANYTRYGFCGVAKKPYLLQEMSRILGSIIRPS